MPRVTPHRPAALRLLLMAWLIDDDALPRTGLRAWLTDHLQDRTWQPTPDECTALAPAMGQWAARYPGLPETVTLALGGVSV